MYFTYHFPALTLGAARTKLGTPFREAVGHVLRHSDRKDPTHIRNLPENVGKAVRNPLEYFRNAGAHGEKLWHTRVIGPFDVGIFPEKLLGHCPRLIEIQIDSDSKILRPFNHAA